MGAETILPPFCNQCGMLIKIHKFYTYCSQCEKFLYKHKKLLLSKDPPVVTPRAVALAALRVEKMNFLHEEWLRYGYEDYHEAFLNDSNCIPQHLWSYDISENVLLDYFDAITEIMISVWIPCSRAILLQTSSKERSLRSS